jgi:hypothetical protein
MTARMHMDTLICRSLVSCTCALTASCDVHLSVSHEVHALAHNTVVAKLAKMQENMASASVVNAETVRRQVLVTRAPPRAASLGSGTRVWTSERVAADTRVFQNQVRKTGRCSPLGMSTSVLLGHVTN